MTRVVFRPLARRDLRDIARYIARRNPARARSFTDELEAAALDLAQFPERGAPRDELASGVRHLVCGNYLILYRYHAGRDLVRILHVVEGHRDLTRLDLDC